MFLRGRPNQEDAQKALEVWERLDAAQCAVQTLPLLYNVADLLSLKGYMKLHSKIYMAVIRLLIGKEISLKECLGMLWRTRSLSHALCNSPIDDSFINELVYYDKRCAYEDVWIHGMRDEEELLVGFKQRFFLFPTLSTPRSIDPNKTQLHDDVCKAASNLLENDPPSNSSSFVAAHMYYDLGERMCAEGLTVKACYYAKKALTLRREIFVKYFRHSPDADNTYYGHKMGIFVHPRRAVVAWSWDTDAISLNECLLTPWNVLKAFLESKLQAAKMEELVGNGSMEQELLTGKTISSLLDLPIFTFGFSSALGNFYMGQARWNPARGEINKAKSILKDLVCCWKCKLVCKATAHQNMGMGISMDIQNGILQTSMTPLNARESYRIARKELVQSKWNVGSVCVNEKANAGKMKFCGVLLSKDSLKDPSHIRGQETVENDGDFSKGECWHCLSSEIMESNSMQGKIDMQWEFIRRRLLLRQLIGLANLHICGNDDDELHPDLARSIYAIGSRNTFLEINIEDSIAFLAMLIKEEIKADMFAVEQASFLYNICWLSLKRIWNKVARFHDCWLFFTQQINFQSCCRALLYQKKVGLQLFSIKHQLGQGSTTSCFVILENRKTTPILILQVFCTGSSGPSSTSLRLAPKSVANFDTFIQIFYEDLPCVPTICVSIFSHDFSDLLLPKQCKAWVMVSRLMSKRVPAVVLLPIFEVIQGELVEEISTKLLDAKDCDKKWCCRWGNSIIDDVAPAFKNLIRDSFVTHKITQMSESNLKAWHAGMKRMEIQLAFLLRSIEESWFGSWKHLLLGDFPENGNLELLLEKLEEGCFVIQESKDRTIVLPEPTDETVDREPVILVLGSECQMLPWESLPIFKKQNQEAYRMPSVARDACYLLNTADIPSLQNHFRDWLKNHYTDGWTVFGSSFTLEKLMEALKRRNLVVYIGHGAEIGCIRPPSSGIIDRWPAGFLVACSSAALKFKGSNNPNGVALDFLVAGSPFVVGMLWDQPVLDQYNIVELVLDEWISTRSSSCRGCTQCKTDLCRHRKTIAACLEKGRQSCVYTHAVGAGVVCYDVPTYIYKT